MSNGVRAPSMLKEEFRGDLVSLAAVSRLSIDEHLLDAGVKAGKACFQHVSNFIHRIILASSPIVRFTNSHDYTSSITVRRLSTGCRIRPLRASKIRCFGAWRNPFSA